MKSVIVLGGGRVGSLMARDLKMDKDIDVTVVDVRKETLAYLKKEFGLKGLQADLLGNFWRGYAQDVGAAPLLGGDDAHLIQDAVGAGDSVEIHP